MSACQSVEQLAHGGELVQRADDFLLLEFGCDLFFVNLLDNASKYSINSNDIEIKTYTKDKKNIISIKNYGSYIDEKEQNAVFEKFYRIDSYLTSKTQGSGLGLYIVKMLIDKMNGNIYINSSNDKIPFCEFIIELPVFAIEEFTKTKKGCSYV